MKEFVNNNITSIFTLTGVVVGALINNIFNWNLKKRETKLIVTKTLIDKRIEAYENIIGISKILRSVVSTYEKDEQSNLISYPRGLEDNESFNSMFTEIFNSINKYSHWIDIKTTRELGFVQDYLVTISRYVKQIADNNGSLLSIKDLGLIIKQDFVNLSSSLEKIISASYPSELIDLQMQKNNKWHKYSKDETTKRFKETYLMLNEKEILSKINHKKK